MNITIEHIKHVSKYNPLLLVKGSAIYRQHHIIKSSVDIDELDVISANATVKEFSVKCFPLVKIMDGEIIHFSCDCKESGPKEGCRHVIGLLYHYMYDLYDTEVKRMLEKNSDPVALDMIELYLQRSMVDAPSVNDVKGVEIRATLDLSDKRNDVPSLLFDIGLEKFYILKDLDQFLLNMEDGTVVTYGKNLSFRHVSRSFSEDSRKIISFIEKKRTEIKMVLNTLSYNSYYGYSAKKNLMLTPGMLDEFIALYMDKYLPIKFPQSIQQMLVVTQNPKLLVTISEKNHDQYVIKISSPFSMIHGENVLYVCMGNILYCCSEKYMLHMNDFLMAMESNMNHLVMHRKHMNAFYNSVFEIIKPYVDSDIQADLNQYEPIPMTARLYFDAYEAMGVSVLVRFVYEEIEYTYKVNRHDTRQNIAEEAKVVHMVLKYFNECDEHGLFTVSDEKQLYELVSYGFQEMGESCELYYSDDFRNIKIKKTPMISAGVRLEEGLLHMSFDFDDFDVSELKQLLSAYRQHKKYYRSKDGSFMQLEQGGMSALSEMMEGFHLSEKDLLKQEITIPKYRAMQMDYFIKNNEQMKVQRDKSFKQLVRDFSSVSDSDFEIDEELKPILRNYQKSGYRWMKTMSVYQFGGILADDMGLGKTLQVIALLKNAKKEFEESNVVSADGKLLGPVSLVVCPASLVLNWEREIEKFANEIRSLVVIGSAIQRKELIEQYQSFDVVITSYDLLKRDLEEYQHINFFYQIIDEAQYIKNHNTQAAKSVKQIQSRQRFALSGTPVENSLAELWSIFDYLMPNYLYPYHFFKHHYEVPIVKDNNQEAIDKLRRMVKPFILRRLKKDVLKELPDKIESTMYCKLEGEQQKLYIANAIEMSKDIRLKFQQDGVEQSKFMVLALLTKLRQLCCHPRLCYDSFTGESSKLDMCMELIRNSVDGKHQVLVFSSFTSMLAIIKEKLIEENIHFFELTGSTPKEKRMQLVNEFQEGKAPVFLISLKAGGTGLNLTAADVVIHFDPWWNVSAQNQATDRTHRIGQTSNVNVYNLIAKDTIEEKILKLQERKLNLADSIVEEGGNMIGSMSRDDILSLFEV